MTHIKIHENRTRPPRIQFQHQPRKTYDRIYSRLES